MLYRVQTTDCDFHFIYHSKNEAKKHRDFIGYNKSNNKN